MKKLILIFIFFNSFELYAGSLDSNFGTFNGYNSFSCFKPYPPNQNSSESDIRNYKIEMNIMIDCIQNYLNAAKNDIDTIKQKMQEAIDFANNR